MDNDAGRNQDNAGLDLGVAVFFLLWAGVGWVSIATNSSLFSGRATGLDPGPALLPIITLAILTAGGLALTVSPVRKWMSASRRIRWKSDLNWRPIGFLACVVAFPTIMHAIGYAAATALFVFFWSFALAPNAMQRPRRTLAIATIAAIVTTLLIYVGFDLVIRSRLP